VAFAFGDYHGATGRAADIVLEFMQEAPSCAA
jgi:hypothetical protein